MFRGQKNRILFKKNNWHLGSNNDIYVCIRCNRYNSIVKINNNNTNYINNDINNNPIYQYCLFCGNPNYINK